ncbi:MAG: choice-of-anchor A family protein [Bacillota bacterium]|nr:choice-of-anchor A family protein [Bacillota bacterium]
MKTKKLLVTCLLLVMIICTGTCTVEALEYQESETTFIDEGGNYSLYYILNHFNHFVRTDVDAGHTIGAVAVGGKANYDRGNGKQEYKQTTSSYMKGTITKIVSDGYFKNLYVGEINKTNTFYHQNEAHTFISKNDCYLDFDQAFDSIKKEANSFIGAGDYKITLDDLDHVSNTNTTFEGEHWSLARINECEKSKVILTVDAQYSYEFEDGVLNSIDRVITNYTANKETMDDISHQEVMLISNDRGSIKIPYVRTLINGNEKVIENTSEWGDGTSFVYMLPNATEVTTNISQQHIGHIVAPNAYLHEMNGNVNGCFVVNKLQILTNVNGGASESHMFPYHGQRIKNDTSKPEDDTHRKRDPKENDKLNKESTSNDSQENNDLKTKSTIQENTSTNNEIILNKEELKTNTSHTLNTPIDSSNNEVVVENKKQTNVKQKDSVKTGDDTHLFMYVLLELLAFVGIVSLRKKA